MKLKHGRGVGQKNSTMSSSEVDTPICSFTNQVKQCTKKVETNAIRKGQEQTQGSFYSSLGVSENNVESSQELISINKNTLVLEKENRQTKFPFSSHQVMQASHTTEQEKKNL